MRAPLKITGPIPTVEETARRLGVSPSRVEEIVQWADAYVDRRLHKGRSGIKAKAATRAPGRKKPIKATVVVKKR